MQIQRYPTKKNYESVSLRCAKLLMGGYLLQCCTQNVNNLLYCLWNLGLFWLFIFTHCARFYFGGSNKGLLLSLLYVSAECRCSVSDAHVGNSRSLHSVLRNSLHKSWVMHLFSLPRIRDCTLLYGRWYCLIRTFPRFSCWRSFYPETTSISGK